jgi:aspartate aminotransferase
MENEVEPRIEGLVLGTWNFIIICEHLLFRRRRIRLYKNIGGGQIPAWPACLPDGQTGRCANLCNKKNIKMISKRISCLTASTTLKITSLTKKLKKEGKDIVNFAAGEPDFDTPNFIKEKAKKAIDEGFTKYTPSAGVFELREEIAKKLKQENNISCEASNIIVTSGAKYAIFSAMLAFVEKGDEVLLPCPYWVSYPEMIKLCQAKIKIFKLAEKNNFKIAPLELKKAINKKTKLLIFNYPNNPTGVTYSRNELSQIYEIIKDSGILVLSDEIYEMLTYDGREHVSFASLDKAHDFTITINGLSKSFSMTGWRLGYLEAKKDYSEAISKIIDHTTSCASSVSQAAALEALKDKEWPKIACTEFEKRRNLLWQGLSTCRKLKPFKPGGTFYMFCDISATGLTSLDFSSKLLEKTLVSTIPADGFGAEGYVRFSFAT